MKLTLGSAGQTCCAVSSQQYTWSTCHSGSRSSTPPHHGGQGLVGGALPRGAAASPKADIFPPARRVWTSRAPPT